MYSGYKKQLEKYLEKDEFRQCEEQRDPDSYNVLKEAEYEPEIMDAGGPRPKPHQSQR